MLAPVADPGRPAALEPSPFQIPCGGAGIRIESFTPSGSILTASLAFEIPDTATGVLIDWVEPYLDLEPVPAFGRLPFLELVVMEWRTTRSAAASRHLVKIGWPPFRDAVMRVRSATTGCESTVACSSDGCEVTS